MRGRNKEIRDMMINVACRMNTLARRAAATIGRRRHDHHRSALAILLLAAVLPLASLGAEPPEEVASVEGITEYRLPNGLKVLLFPDASRPKVTVNLTIFVGSRHEGYGEAGMAHLLEHMLFKGTPTHSEVPKLLTSRGAEYNGTTWVDRTNYYESLPANDENLEFAIRLEADRMMNSYVKGEDLASEMTVVRNEFERGENSPSRILGQRMMATAYEWHNYGQSTIGNRADIERVPVESLRVFYKKYYQPDNAMIVVAGRFDPDKALELVTKYFGPIPRPERTLSNTYTEEPAQDGERLVTLRRVGDVSVVGLLYHISSGAHPDFAAVDVLESAMTAKPAGRLYKALVETKKASSVEGGAYAWHDPGALRFMAEVTQQVDPNIVLGTALDVVEGISEEPLTAEEVDRAKRRLLKQWELAFADSGKIAIQLSEWASMGDWRLCFLYRDRLEAVTPEIANEAADRYLKQSNRTVGIFLPTEEPERSTVPQTPAIAGMVDDYKGRAAVATGEVFDVSPENIDARTERLRLPSGLEVALIEKKTRGGLVNLRLTLRYGDEENLNGMTSACELLPDLMLRGTKNLSRQEIQDALDANSAQLKAQGVAGEATFTIQTKRDNLPAVLDIFRQVLREPTLPQQEVEILTGAQISALEQRLKDPQTLATRAVRKMIYPYEPADPRYIPSVEEEIEMMKALDVSHFQRLYNDHLSSQFGELTIIGDFDRDATLQSVHDIMSGFSATANFDRLRYYVFPGIEGSTRDILTPGKANAMYFAAMAMPVRDDDPDYAALVVGNQILGGSALSSRLGDRVRQRDGLSYGVGSGFQARAADPRAAFYIYAIANPDNIPQVKAAILEEIDLLLEDGITQKELDDAREGYLQSQAVTRAADARLARIIEKNMLAGRTMKHHSDLETQIRSLGTDDVIEAFRKHLSSNRLTIAAAGDLERGDKTASNDDPAPAKPKAVDEEGKISAAHILIMHKDSQRVPPDITRTKEQALALAKEIAAKARSKNADFAALAEEYSDGPSGPRGGDLGSFAPERMVKPFSDATLKLAVGEVSDPVETAFGYHIIRRQEVKTRRQEVKPILKASAKHILVRYKGTKRASVRITRTKDEALERIEECLKRSRKGEKFEDLAKEYSDGPTGARGGDLGEFTQGRMTPSFDKAVFACEVGKVTGIVETPFGYHIIYRYK